MGINSLKAYGVRNFENYRMRVKVLLSRNSGFRGLAPVVNVEPTVLAGRQGFEPRYADPDSAVLPLDDLPTLEWRIG